MREIALMYDESPVAQLLRQVLEDEGYDVTVTEGAEATIALLRTHPRPLVALLHHRSTEESVIEVLAAAETEGGPLRRHGYVLLDAHDLASRLDHRQQIFRMGAWLLSIPFDLQTLLHTVKDAAASCCA
jgi:DNA-binding NtrC family response regulator